MLIVVSVGSKPQISNQTSFRFSITSARLSPAIMARLNDRELVEYKPIVVINVGKIDKPNRVAINPRSKTHEILRERGLAGECGKEVHLLCAAHSKL